MSGVPSAFMGPMGLLAAHGVACGAAEAVTMASAVTTVVSSAHLAGRVAETCMNVLEDIPRVLGTLLLLTGSLNTLTFLLLLTGKLQYLLPLTLSTLTFLLLLTGKLQCLLPLTLSTFTFLLMLTGTLPFLLLLTVAILG